MPALIDGQVLIAAIDAIDDDLLLFRFRTALRCINRALMECLVARNENDFVGFSENHPIANR